MSLKRTVKRRTRRALMRRGARMSTRRAQGIRSAHSYLDLGKWAVEHAGGIPKDHDAKEALFDIALGRVTGDRPLYLEFGVYTGGTLRWWVEHLTTPGARFVGFDSFEGLPEDWNMGRGKGAFAVDQIPQFDDDRVSFQVGWFEKTVPDFEVPPHDQLVVNIDSDLYSSAVLALDRLEPHLVPGSLIYFDELNDRDHELRALKEFLARSGKTVRALGSSAGGTNWLVEVTG